MSESLTVNYKCPKINVFPKTDFFSKLSSDLEYILPKYSRPKKDKVILNRHAEPNSNMLAQDDRPLRILSP